MRASQQQRSPQVPPGWVSIGCIVLRFKPAMAPEGGLFGGVKYPSGRRSFLA